MRFSKKLIVAIVILDVIFAGIVLWIFYKTQVEPVALVAAWFAGMTLEKLTVASIKKQKIVAETAQAVQKKDETKKGESDNGEPVG